LRKAWLFVADKFGPAVPCTAGFDPADAGGVLPNDSALPEGYRVIALGQGTPFYQNVGSKPRVGFTHTAGVAV